ncbi:MAG: hypothetical protein Q9195_001407 [Heterodermia aff. obscurata]
MAPLALAQDRLARGQNPGPLSCRPGPKSPGKSRVPKGLPPNNEVRDRRQLEIEDEMTQGAKENEMWEESQQRHKAAVILGSWEMVTWSGIAGNESNPQTALRFKRMMIGLKDQPSDDQWEDERNPGDDDVGYGSSKHTGNSPLNKGGAKRKH